MNRSSRPWTVLAAAVLLPAAVASGQTDDVVRRLERQQRQLDALFRYQVPSDQPISERLVFDYGGSVRFGFYSIDDSNGTSRFLRQTDGVAYVRSELDGAHRFFGRLNFDYYDYNNGESLDGRGDRLDEPIADRYWYQYDHRGAHRAATGERLDWNLTARLGRQTVRYGSGLALDSTLYAAVVEHERGNVVLGGLIGLTPSTGTVDFDGSRPGFNTDTDRTFVGVSLEWGGSATHRPYAYYLVQNDENERDSAVLGGALTRFNYDSEYIGLGSRGSLGPSLNYHVEAVYETGDGLSNSFNPTTFAPTMQTREDIDAWAFLAGLTWLMRDDANTRVDLEFAGGTGDGDRLDASNTFGGNRPGTKDHSFNSLGYINTGLVLAPELPNLLSARLSISTSPTDVGGRAGWLRLGVSGFVFGKLDSSAPVTIGTVRGKSFIGGEIDFFADWRLASDLTASLYYGIFIPGDAMPAGQADVRHFLHMGVTYAF